VSFAKTPMSLEFSNSARKAMIYLICSSDVFVNTKGWFLGWRLIDEESFGILGFQISMAVTVDLDLVEFRG
jgi:hypothetical protein